MLTQISTLNVLMGHEKYESTLKDVEIVDHHKDPEQSVEIKRSVSLACN